MPERSNSVDFVLTGSAPVVPATARRASVGRSVSSRSSKKTPKKFSPKVGGRRSAKPPRKPSKTSSKVVSDGKRIRVNFMLNSSTLDGLLDLQRERTTDYSRKPSVSSLVDEAIARLCGLR